MPSQFFWYDLVTSDVAAARKFYCEVVGWTYDDMSQADNNYGVFKAGDVGVAGLMPFPAEMKAGGHPGWNGYIAVEDVDAVAARIRSEAGARSIAAPPKCPV